MNIDDTIVAISSPSGGAQRGIVRLSGPAAIAITDSVFESSQSWKEGTCSVCVQGSVRFGTTKLPAEILVFRAPRSYSRQDVIELHLLGSPPLLARLVESCLAAGSRRAEAGEFTARAFLAGAMDIAQVSGIAGMIAARSTDELHAAQRLLYGALSETALSARERIADLLSLVEGALDFADEPIEFITPAQLRERLGAVRQSLAAIGAAGTRTERFDRLPAVVLTGAPNAGKSSLLNRLAGEERAICTPIAGTTRDVLTATVPLGSITCRFVDVAGRGEPNDAIEAAAQAAAARAVADADLVLQVVDASINPQMLQRIGDVLVLNKADLLLPLLRTELSERFADYSPCWVSALTGEGIELLSLRIEGMLGARTADRGDAAIALMAEHRDALERTIQAIDAAIAIAAGCDEHLEDADLVAAELRQAAESLGRLVGEEDTEELLGRIFARFCVGK
jgi:tRNA modification GTPase